MNTELRSDQELLKVYVNGNKAAIEQLIERHRRKVYNYILMMVKNQSIADDIFQETFIKVIASLDRGKYSENGKFVSWVLRIAHNQIIDHFRSKKSAPQITNDDVGYDILNHSKYSEATVEEKIIQEQISEDVRKLVDYLPIEQREVVILRHYMGLSFKEIAEQTEVSINTALGRMRYALINLRKLIEDKQLSLV